MDVTRERDREGREVLRRYLLGSASPDERVAVEDSLLSEDDGTFDRLVEVEDELIDEAAAGNLPPEDAARFGAYLGRVPGRRQELDVALALAGRRRAVAGPSGAPRRAAPRADWTVVRAAAVLIVAAGAAMLLYATRDAPEAPDPAAPASGARAPAPAAPVILFEGQLRSDGARPVVVSGASEPVVRLELREELARDYLATIRDADAREVGAFAGLRSTSDAGRLFVSVTIPASDMAPGDYFVELSGRGADGRLRTLARYDFRLARP